MADGKKSAPSGGNDHKQFKDLEEHAKKLGEAVSASTFLSTFLHKFLTHSLYSYNSKSSNNAY
jgi:hypothetical protein